MIDKRVFPIRNDFAALTNPASLKMENSIHFFSLLSCFVLGVLVTTCSVIYFSILISLYIHPCYSHPLSLQWSRMWQWWWTFMTVKQGASRSRAWEDVTVTGTHREWFRSRSSLDLCALPSSPVNTRNIQAGSQRRCFPVPWTLPGLFLASNVCKTHKRRTQIPRVLKPYRVTISILS